MSEKKVILKLIDNIPEELNDIISKFEIVSDQDKKDIDYIISDNLEKIPEDYKGLPTVVLCQDDIMTEFENNIIAFNKNLLSSPFFLIPIKRFFDEEYSIHLESSYGELLSNINLLKINDPLSVGFYSDVITEKAYNNNINLYQVRIYFTSLLSYLTSLYKNDFIDFAFDVNYGSGSDCFLVSLNIDSSRFDTSNVKKDLLNKNNNLILCSQQCNLFDIYNLEKTSKIVFTALWSKDNSANNVNYSNVLIQNISDLKGGNISTSEIIPDLKLVKDGVKFQKDKIVEDVITIQATEDNSSSIESLTKENEKDKHSIILEKYKPTEALGEEHRQNKKDNYKEQESIESKHAVVNEDDSQEIKDSYVDVEEKKSQNVKDKHRSVGGGGLQKTKDRSIASKENKVHSVKDKLRVTSGGCQQETEDGYTTVKGSGQQNIKDEHRIISGGCQQETEDGYTTVKGSGQQNIKDEHRIISGGGLQGKEDGYTVVKGSGQQNLKKDSNSLNIVNKKNNQNESRDQINRYKLQSDSSTNSNKVSEYQKKDNALEIEKETDNSSTIAKENEVNNKKVKKLQENLDKYNFKYNQAKSLINLLKEENKKLKFKVKSLNKLENNNSKIDLEAAYDVKKDDDYENNLIDSVVEDMERIEKEEKLYERRLKSAQDNFDKNLEDKEKTIYFLRKKIDALEKEKTSTEFDKEGNYSSNDGHSLNINSNNQLEDKDKIINDNSKVINNLKKKIDILNSKLSQKDEDSSLRVSSLSNDNQLSSNIDSNKQLENKDRIIKDKDNKIKSLRESVEILNKKLNDKEFNFKKVDYSQTNKDEELIKKTYDKQLEVKDKTINVLRGKVDELDNQLNKKGFEASKDTSSTIKDYDKQLEYKDKIIQDKDNRIFYLRKEIDELNKKLKENDNKVKTSQSNIINNLNADIDKLKQENAKLRKSISMHSASSKTSDKKEEVELLEKKIRHVTNKLEDMRKLNKVLSEELADKKKDIHKLNTKNKNLETKIGSSADKKKAS